MVRPARPTVENLPTLRVGEEWGLWADEKSALRACRHDGQGVWATPLGVKTAEELQEQGWQPVPTPADWPHGEHERVVKFDTLRAPIGDDENQMEAFLLLDDATEKKKQEFPDLERYPDVHIPSPPSFGKGPRPKGQVFRGIRYSVPRLSSLKHHK